MECDLNFIKKYLVFHHEDYWPRVIYHIMYDLEYLDQDTCKKIAKKLIEDKKFKKKYGM